MMKTRILFCVILFLGTACRQPLNAPDSGKVDFSKKKIVSLNGAITELLFEANLGGQIVGVDVTSDYPEATKDIAKVGYTRQMNAEGILALGPDIIVGLKNEMKPELLQQLQATGREVYLFEKGSTKDSVYLFFESVLTKFDQLSKFDSLKSINEKVLSGIKSFSSKPKVLFIYARGVGNLMAAGSDTPMQSFIELSGATNAATGFSGYKPLNAESVALFNPDVILMFEDGLRSIKGAEELWKIPGLANTVASKNNLCVAMDGSYMSNFGPRFGKACLEFNSQLDIHFD
jgi:iron complex transport system substrate-binding protein